MGPGSQREVGVRLVWLAGSCCGAAQHWLLSRALLPTSCWDLALGPCLLLLKMPFTGGKWYVQHRPVPVQVNCYTANSFMYHSLPVRITAGSQHQFSSWGLSAWGLWWRGLPWTTKSLPAHISFLHRLSITNLTGTAST